MEKNWTNFKREYLSQFSTYWYKTPLFGIVRSRCFLRGVKRRSRPTQSREIEQNVKKNWTTFTFCSISLDWVGQERCFTPHKKHLLLTIPKSGVSYLYVENWLRHAVLKWVQFFFTFTLFGFLGFCLKISLLHGENTSGYS